SLQYAKPNITNIPVVDLGNDTSLCTNSFLIDASQTPGNYLWSTGATTSSITVSSTGLYWVLVDNGCGGIGSDSINVIFGIVDVNLGNDTLLCSGDQLILDAGNPGASFLWQDG